MSFCYNIKEFNGQKVSEYNKEKGIEDVNIAYKFAFDWDNEEDPNIALEAFFKDPKISEITNIVIGNYGEADESVTPLLKTIMDNKDKIQNLKGIFFGDITYEENECSWIENDNFGPFLKAFPNLEYFRVRGANDLGFSFLDHQNLKTFIIESGGLDSDILEAIAKADLPKLEHLELWLGTENYGFGADAKQVAEVYRGKNKENHLPSLKYLGLRNCEIADDVAKEMINDPILKRIEILDFSKGTICNNGAKAILENPLMENLKFINLEHNFIADELAVKLEAKFGDKINLEERSAIGLDVDLDSDDFDMYDYDMYVEVSE